MIPGDLMQENTYSEFNDQRAPNDWVVPADTLGSSTSISHPAIVGPQSSLARFVVWMFWLIGSFDCGGERCMHQHRMKHAMCDETLRHRLVQIYCGLDSVVDYPCWRHRILLLFKIRLGTFFDENPEIHFPFSLIVPWGEYLRGDQFDTTLVP